LPKAFAQFSAGDISKKNVNIIIAEPNAKAKSWKRHNKITISQITTK
jgi:hypothetical protein